MRARERTQPRAVRADDAANRGDTALCRAFVARQTIRCPAITPAPAREPIIMSGRSPLAIIVGADGNAGSLLHDAILTSAREQRWVDVDWQAFSATTAA